ncbi:MAG: alpha/beta hydrolase [Terracidiphilus sp.]
MLGVLLGLYLLALTGFFVLQRSFLYFPSQDHVSISEAHANRAFKEFSVRTEDGLDLTAWYAPATNKTFTIVFFHGNGDCLFTASPVAAPYIAAGYGFLLAEYRGYSGLPGKPTEAGLYADARAYLKGLMARGVKSENIILFGHSLGTGVAVQMAEEFHVSGVMLLAPYLSIAKMAQLNFPYFPAKYIALDRYENDKKMKNLHEPLLIVNGARDQLIPPSQGKQLYDLANEPRQFDSIPARGHNNCFDDFATIGLNWIKRLPVPK